MGSSLPNLMAGGGIRGFRQATSGRVEATGGDDLFPGTVMPAPCRISM